MKVKSCNLCGNTEFSLIYATKDRMFGFNEIFNLKKCNKCSLTFLDPQPEKNELKKYYPTKKYYSYKKIKKGFITLLREYLIRHYYSPNILSYAISNTIKNVPAMPRAKKNGKILDLGCGTGETLLLLKELGWDTYGIEIDKNAIEIGKKSGLSNLKLGTYKTLATYPDNYFDAIRLYHVIEHLDDPVFALKLIRKKLKKGGELIVGTPNIDSFAGRLFKTYWYNLDSPRHLYLFSPKTLNKMIITQSFRPVFTEFCSAGGLAGSIQYVLKYKLNRRINLVHNFTFFLMIYPLEWILDKIKQGDVFTVKAIK